MHKITHLGNNFWVWLYSMIWLWDLENEFLWEIYESLQQNKKWNILLNSISQELWWQSEIKHFFIILSYGSLFRWCSTQIMDSFVKGAVLTVKSSNFTTLEKSVFSETCIGSALIRYLFGFSGNLLYGKKVIL